MSEAKERKEMIMRKKLLCYFCFALVAFGLCACGGNSTDKAAEVQQDSDRLELTTELQNLIISDRLESEYIEGSGLYNAQADIITAATWEASVEKALQASNSSRKSKFTCDIDYQDVTITSYEVGNNNNVLVYGKLYGIDKYGNTIVQQFDFEYYFEKDETSDTGYKAENDILKIVDE